MKYWNGSAPRHDQEPVADAGERKAADVTSLPRRLHTHEPPAQLARFDPGLLKSLLSHAIARAHLAGDATFHAAIGERSITPLRFSLLELVAANPGLQQVQLAEALELSRSAVTLVIDYWQARACLERRSEPNDRRSFGIFLTDVGTALLADLRRRVLIHERKLAAGLNASEQRELIRLLGKLHGCRNMPAD